MESKVSSPSFQLKTLPDLEILTSQCSTRSHCRNNNYTCRSEPVVLQLAVDSVKHSFHALQYQQPLQAIGTKIMVVVIREQAWLKPSGV